MSISCCQFLFHPLHQDHSTATRVLSVITNIALTILTGGLYLFVVLAMRETSPPIPALPATQVAPTHVAMIKEKQQNHLAKLKGLALRGQWEHLREHTRHPDSGFDWWMFPIDKDSNTHGPRYKVSAAEVALLRQDPLFMRNYREGVCLVAKAWGWNLETGAKVTNEKQRWVGYQVRLGKMLDSLRLFGQDDLRRLLIQFIRNDAIHIDQINPALLLV